MGKVQFSFQDTLFSGRKARALSWHNFCRDGPVMSLKHIMTLEPQCIGPGQPVIEAAQVMEKLDIGMLPVCENDRLIGTVTDRDIAIRAVARGLDPRRTPVREVMTADLIYCLEDETIEEACRIMENHQIRRVPVLNEEKRLVGIVSLGDVAVRTKSELLAGEVLTQVSEPPL